jgi:NTP pyrophosphatase (non-canonical NTP hydrolase)
MEANVYQRLAARTIGQIVPDLMLRHGVFGLASEAGEVSGLFQKLYQGHNLEDEHLKKELGDVLWMVAEICTARGFTLDEVMEMNLGKLQERYPYGFESERSLHRKEGDI